MTAGFADRLHSYCRPLRNADTAYARRPVGADARAPPFPNGKGGAAGATSGLLTDKRALNGRWKQKHLAARGCSLASRPPARTAAPLSSRCRCPAWRLGSRWLCSIDKFCAAAQYGRGRMLHRASCSVAAGLLLALLGNPAADAQTPPSATEMAAYRGLHAAAAGGNVAEIAAFTCEPSGSERARHSRSFASSRRCLPVSV